MRNRNAHTTSVGHPEPQRDRIGDGRRALNLFGAAGAWMLQMSLSAIITSRACYLHQSLTQHAIFPLMPTLFLLHVICIFLGACSSYIAYQSWRETKRGSPHSTPYVIETGEGRSRFLSLMGLSASMIFMSAILFTACAVLLMSPCRGA